MAFYVVSGPYEIPLKSIHRGLMAPDYSNNAMKDFWKTVNARSKLEFDISSALGCYIYAVGAAGETKPWYVGKTDRGFKVDVFKKSNQSIYFTDWPENDFVTPYIFFIIALDMNKKGYDVTYKVRKSVGKTELNWVENYLIQRASETNSKLLNIRNRHSMRVCIPGVLNAVTSINTYMGESRKPAQILERILSFRKIQDEDEDEDIFK